MSAFEKMVEPYRRKLRLHCYRMLGSSHDSDDMVQEAFVRAFRSQHALEDPSAVSAWLYRIATNVCLDELKKRPRRARGPELGPPSDPDAPPAPPTPDDEWLEPAPSSWLDLDEPAADPAAQYTLKESVALAFVAALQILTPPQRAVLLLRDVVGLSAAETAEALECSLSAANSTLHRARTALEEQVGIRSDHTTRATAAVDRALLERYMRAWESGDLKTIISLLHEEATLSMPPVRTWVTGREAVGRFFENRARQARDGHAFKAVIVEANGGLAVGFYRVNGERHHSFFAIHAVEMRDGLIAVVDHFMAQSSHEAFFAEGLSRSFEA